MPIVSHKGLNKTVQNLAERDAITPKIDGMEVMVNDTTGDEIAGTGIAVYKWNASTSTWLLEADDDAISFTASDKALLNSLSASTVTSVAGKSGNVILEASDISDLNNLIGTIQDFESSL